MNYKIIITDNYLKKAKKFFKKHSDILSRYEKAFKLLEINPSHPSLRFHKLQGGMKEYYSISITMEYRVVIDFIIEKDTIVPIDIGTHNEVY